jgi:anti-sigma factor RsiW
VKHRHLLPNEIDLLVDGEVGFGVAPLRAHLRECAECEAKVDEAREVATALEELPHLAPSTLFSERVMSQVQVFEPWHVAARDSLARLVPRSTPARAAAVVFGSGAAIVLASLSIWIAGRLDILAFLSGAAVQRSREVITSLVEGVIGTAFGPAALSFVRGTGSVGLIIATLALAGAAGIAVMGVRRLATASSRRAGGS